MARAVAAVCRACGDSTAAALGLWEGWDVRGRQDWVVGAPQGSSWWIDIHQAASVTYLQLQYYSSWPYKNELINKHVSKGGSLWGRAMCLLAPCEGAGLKVSLSSGEDI